MLNITRKTSLAHLLIILCLSCNFVVKDDQNLKYPAKENLADLTGNQLAKIYCGNCHLFPEPNLLPKHIWEASILPQMGLRLGVPHPKLKPYAGMSGDAIIAVSLAGVFPYDSMITKEAWEKIQIYYLENAPDSFSIVLHDRLITNQLDIFKPRILPFKNFEGPFITLLKFDTLQKELWVGTGSGRLTSLKTSGLKMEKIYSQQFESPPSDIHIQNNGDKLLLTMGDLNPNNDPKGQVIKINQEQITSVLIDSLYRPVDFLVADLSQKENIIIGEFGYHIGKLSQYDVDTNNNSIEKVLKNQPGAIQLKAHDFNSDGLTDIMVLMAQGDENITIYYNEGTNKLRPEVVLHLPPVYGSNYFELADFNNDGYQDILMTNGDNADYSYTAKPFHGVHIFLNDGNNQFRESYYFPLFGASKAITRDFDQDGDLDIAAIAFFNEYVLTPNNGFVYLENISTINHQLKFEPTIFEKSEIGRWIVMETADFDQDNDLDIILGAFTFTNTSVPQRVKELWRKEEVNLLILENLKN